MMSPLLALQAASTSSAESMTGMIGLVGGLIGIYAARRRYGKASFRDLSATAIMLGAGLGTLFLGLLPLTAALMSDVSNGYSFSYWVGTGIGGALFIGGTAALIARLLGPSKPSDAGHPPQ